MARPQIKIADRERRTISHKVEVRKDENGKESREIFGYAAKFNDESNMLGFGGDFYEVIEPGAFDDVLGDDVRALYNHEASAILARTQSGTLNIGVDEIGLWYRFDSPETSFGNDLLVSIKRGDISQSSFQFIVADDSWVPETKDGKEIWKRSIKKVERLYDVAPVTFPAYSSTEVVARSLEAAKAEKIQAPEIEIREEIVEEITEDVQEPPIIEQPERTIKTAYRKRQIEILKLKNKNIALAA